MKNPKAGQTVRYTGGFPEFEEELWDIVTVFPGGQDIEVFGHNSHRLLRKSRADFKSALKISGSGRGVSEEALIEFAQTLSPDKAKKHGFTGNYAKDRMQLLQLGSITVEVTRESLVTAKKEILNLEIK